jgi:hypothetical protein
MTPVRFLRGTQPGSNLWWSTHPGPVWVAAFVTDTELLHLPAVAAGP